MAELWATLTAAAAAVAYLHATFAHRRELRELSVRVDALGERIHVMHCLLVRVAAQAGVRLGPSTGTNAAI